MHKDEVYFKSWREKKNLFFVLFCFHYKTQLTLSNQTINPPRGRGPSLPPNYNIDHVLREK